MRRKSQTKLLRVLGLGAIVIYGVGDILGAGIYALIGEIAGHAGSFTWLSFAIAMSIVFFTALTYGELGSRFPRSGGVSVYVQQAFGLQWLSVFAGLLLFSATVLSMSTLSHAFIGYVKTFGVNVPNALGVTGFLMFLMLINLRGIKQSSIANIISTAVEVSGLLIVLVCGFFYLLKKPDTIIAAEIHNTPSIKSIFQGAALAFFAFTGFEDLANIAEEVKHPEKNIPRAILSSLGAAGLLYLCVSWMATAIIPGPELSASHAPLLDVVNKSYPDLPDYLFSIIAIFAISNTILLNYITASRLLYGMSEAHLLPQFLCKVHPRFHTPYVTILLIFPIVLGLSLSGTLGGLASSTSAVVLIIFSLSSISLIKIKQNHPLKKGQVKIFQIPAFIPVVAVCLNLTAITFLPLANVLTAIIFFILVGVIAWFSTDKELAG